MLFRIYLNGFVVVYDHIISSGSEVRLIWHNKLYPVSLSFSYVRYFSLGCSVVIFLIYFGILSPELLKDGASTRGASDVAARARPKQQRSPLRIFAMYDPWVAVPLSIPSTLSATLRVLNFAAFRDASTPWIKSSDGCPAQTLTVRPHWRLGGTGFQFISVC
ncbi:hypothetical protein B0H19DRAFT_1066681 [Mycena capillaripes]|nr:hypothetical protein B0H19DRAFT_1066681 [Mycena capillaripes]